MWTSISQHQSLLSEQRKGVESGGNPSPHHHAAILVHNHRHHRPPPPPPHHSTAPSSSSIQCPPAANATAAVVMVSFFSSLPQQHRNTEHSTSRCRSNRARSAGRSVRKPWSARARALCRGGKGGRKIDRAGGVSHHVASSAVFFPTTQHRPRHDA